MSSSFQVPLLLLASLSTTAYALRASQLPEDVYAWPKYKISFLNNLPVLNETAHRWLQTGLHGGMDEFLEQHLSGNSPPPPIPQSRPEISDGTQPDSDELATSVQAPMPSTTPSALLQHIRLGPSQEFVCFVPPPPIIPPYTEDNLTSQPTRPWELLQPLDGTCLYHRQGWFSYAYCHNRYVRQFREREPQLPLGMKEPQEDPNEDSYTLGHAPSTNPSSEHDQQENGERAVSGAIANKLELARAAGHRYLIQRWGDGTVCDKTGRKREIEVQFHCSMVSKDTIYFIKETRTCQYTLVIHTPRLCGEPGFKSPRDDLADTPIRCRKIVDSPAAIEAVDKNWPETSYPVALQPKPKPLPMMNTKPNSSPTENIIEFLGTGGADGEDKEAREMRQKLIRMAIDALLNRPQPGGGDGEGDGAQARIGEDGVVAVGIDQNGLWMEQLVEDKRKKKDTTSTTNTGNAGTGKEFKESKESKGGKGNEPKPAAAAGKDAKDAQDGDALSTVEIEVEDRDEAFTLADMLRRVGIEVEIQTGDEEEDDDDYYYENNLDEADDPVLRAHDEL